MFENLMNRYGLTKDDVNEFVYSFIYLNKDGVLNLPLGDSEWTTEKLMEFVQKGILLGFRSTDTGDKTFIYLTSAFRDEFSRCVMASCRSYYNPEEVK